MQMLSTTKTSIIGRHEASFWDDGVLEIEEIADGQNADHVYEQVVLDELAQLRLYMLLEAKFKRGGTQP